VYREGDKVDSVYVIKSGRFKLVKKIFLKDNSLSDSHKHSPELVHMHSSIHAERARSYIDVAVLESGASFGEDEIMRKSDHRFYTAICDSSEGIILRIEKNDFLGKIFHIYKDKDRRDIRRSEKFKISIREK
jgi:CRP-like cAMP-binding protein